MCVPESPEVSTLRAEINVWKERSEELLNALDDAHSVQRCPRNANGLCKPCNALLKYKDEIPDAHLVACVVCKELIRDTFDDRKRAWCEECGGGVYVCPLCRAAHNMQVHRSTESEK